MLKTVMTTYSRYSQDSQSKTMKAAILSTCQPVLFELTDSPLTRTNRLPAQGDEWRPVQ